MLFLLSSILSSAIVFLPLLPTASATNGCRDTITTSTTLSADVGPCPGNGIIVTASNIVLNCAGHTVTGTGSARGIFLNGATGVTVENCNVTGFTYGLYNYGGSNTLTSDTASGNEYGFYIRATSYATLNGDTATGNSGSGIYLYATHYSSLSGNTASSNGNNGIQFSSSTHNTVSGNTADGNRYYGYYDSARRINNAFSSNECSGNGQGGSSPTGFCTDEDRNRLLYGFKLGYLDSLVQLLVSLLWHLILSVSEALPS